jgi:hypothetical protein
MELAANVLKISLLVLIMLQYVILSTAPTTTLTTLTALQTA